MVGSWGAGQLIWFLFSFESPLKSFDFIDSIGGIAFVISFVIQMGLFARSYLDAKSMAGEPYI